MARAPSSRPLHKATVATARVGTLALVLLALWGLWEGYRRLWIETGWTRPFVIDSTTMPHLHDIVGALFEPIQVGGPSSAGAPRYNTHDNVVSARNISKTFGKGGLTALQDIGLEVTG